MPYRNYYRPPKVLPMWVLGLAVALIIGAVLGVLAIVSKP